jgi:glycosyltransferase involved in cell wall biosynthesis
LRHLFKRIAPDVVWVPSYLSLLHLSRLSIPGDVLPLGVDLGVLRPPGDGEKYHLRSRLDVARDAFVFLHVGRVGLRRNLEALTALLESARAEVILVGSTSTPEDRALGLELESKGIKVISELVNVEEFYRLADCYVFPAENTLDCVEIPSSVIEALASGLPVLTTPFGGLKDFFRAGEDLRYWRTEEELRAAAVELRANRPPEVRDMSEFSWDRIGQKMLETLRK